MKAFRFEGTGFEYFKIWIVNILLTIITLGLYYPWAKVRTNRYFYANTTLQDRNFEFHATGKQLFIAHLIAIGLFILYNILGAVFVPGALILLGILFLAIPWIIWRSRIFRMKMSSFSNVRFGFTGSLKDAYINFLGLPILLLLVYGLIIGLVVMATKILGPGTVAGIFSGIIILLGIVALIYMYAYIKKKNSDYLINGSKYGSGQFTTNLETHEFFKIIFKAILLSIIGLVLTGLLVYVLVGGQKLAEFMMTMQMMSQSRRAIPMMSSPFAMYYVIGGFYLFFILGTIALMSYLTARYREYILANTLLDNKISFVSTLKARSLTWVSLTNLLVIIISMGLAYPWAQVRMMRLLATQTRADTSVGFEEYVSEKQQEQSSLGEQIGDAFDVDVGIGF